MKQIFVSDVLNTKKIPKSLKKDRKKTESFSEILKNLKKLKYASGKITETESLRNAKTSKKAQIVKVPDVSKALKEKDVGKATKEKVVSERKTSNPKLSEIKDEKNQKKAEISEKGIRKRISAGVQKEAKVESSQGRERDEVPKAEVFGKKKIVVGEKEDLKLRRKIFLDKASFESSEKPLKSQLVKEIKKREISEKASFPKKENVNSAKIEKRDLNPRSKVKEEYKKENLAGDIPQKEKTVKRSSEDLQKNFADETSAQKKFSNVVQKKEMERVHSSSENNSKKDGTVELERRVGKRAEYKETPSKDGVISKKDDKSGRNQEDPPIKNNVKNGASDERVEKLKSSHFAFKETEKKEKKSFENYSETFKKLSLDEPKRVLSEHAVSTAKEDKQSFKKEGKDSGKIEEDARVFEKKRSEFSKDVFSFKEKFSKMKATDEKPHRSSPLMKVSGKKKAKERVYKFVRKNSEESKTPEKELIRSVKPDSKKASIFEKISPSKEIVGVPSKLTHSKVREENPLKDNVTAKDHQSSRKKSEKPSRKENVSNSRANEKLIFRKRKDVLAEKLLSKEKSNSEENDSGNFFQGFSKGEIVGSDDSGIFRKKSADSKNSEFTKKEKSPKIVKIEASKKSAGEMVFPGHEDISEAQSESLIESHLEKILSRNISKKIDEKPFERKFIEKISKAKKRIDISKSEIKNQISKVKSKIEKKYSRSEKSAVENEDKTNVNVEKINNVENPISIPVSSQKLFQKDKPKLEEILRSTKNNAEISKDLRDQFEKSIDFKENEKRKEILENLKIEVTVSKKVKEVYQSYRYDHKKFKDIFRKVQQVKEDMNLIRFSEKTNFKDTQKVSDVPSGKRVGVEEIIERISRILESKRDEPKLVEKARMDLDPPNLGKLEVEISKEDKNITLIFRVSSQYTKDLIERKLDALVHRLSSDGFNIEKIEVRMEKSENHEEDLTDHQENRGQREKDENEKKEKREEGEEK